MTISELIKILESLDPDRVVILSRDSEGNSYRLLKKGDIAGKNTAYIDRCGIEVGPQELTHKLKLEGYSQEDVVSGGLPAVVFY